jgi:MFS family permease
MRAFFKNTGISLKLGMANSVLLANAFIWYFLAFSILREIMATLELPNNEIIVVLGVNFAGIALSGIVGSLVVDKFKKRAPFLYGWTLSGVFLSLVPLVFSVTNYFSLIVVSAVFGLYFGIGMPATMGYYASSTSPENRSRLGGITFLVIALSFSILGNLGTGDIVVAGSVLTAVRVVGLLLLSLLRLSEKNQTHRQISYKSVLLSRPFMLYFIPWCMFNLVNYLTTPFLTRLFTEGNYIELATIVENILIAAFAVISGFLSDVFGRKRLTIVGFAMLGIGYAVMGLTQGNIVGWYFYVCVDGAAWGIFYAILFFTIWGDLAQGRHSEKFYVIGILPYLFSNFMRLLLEPYVYGIPAGEIFTFACVFLFLAVLPLIYAPETLPEKSMKDRDLKSYLEKALKKAQREAEKTKEKEAEENKKETAEAEEDVGIYSEEYEQVLKEAEKYY